MAKVYAGQQVLLPFPPEGIRTHLSWVHTTSAKAVPILREAQSKHMALAVCRLDLANAYGIRSVHHFFIQQKYVYHNTLDNPEACTHAEEQYYYEPDS